MSVGGEGSSCWVKRESGGGEGEERGAERRDVGEREELRKKERGGVSSISRCFLQGDGSGGGKV